MKHPTRVIFFFFLSLLLTLSQQAEAQKYTTAAGVRISRSDFGLTVQQKVFNRGTIEGIGGFSPRETRGTLLLERHFPIVGKPFNYYIGGGAHMGWLREYGTFYGLDAIAGLELKVPIFPVVASIDLKPAVHANYDRYVSFNGAISLRYILVREQKKDRRVLGIFGRKKEEQRRGGIFRKKQEPPPKRGIFRKKPEPEPVKQRRGIFGKKHEPEPEPEPPKRRLRLFEKKPEMGPPPPPQTEKRRLRLFEKEQQAQPQPEQQPQEERKIRW